MQKSIFIGLDVQKAMISVVVAADERDGEILHLESVPDRPNKVRKLPQRPDAGGGKRHFR